MPTREDAWGHIRVRPEVWKQLKEICKKEQRTQAAIIERALAKYIKSDGNK